MAEDQLPETVSEELKELRYRHARWQRAAWEAWPVWREHVAQLAEQVGEPETIDDELALRREVDRLAAAADIHDVLTNTAAVVDAQRIRELVMGVRSGGWVRADEAFGGLERQLQRRYRADEVRPNLFVELDDLDDEEPDRVRYVILVLALLQSLTD